MTALRAIAAVWAALALTPTAAGTPDQTLLRRYQPVTVFERLDRFRPVVVDAFAADAELQQRTPEGWIAAPSPATLPAADPPGCSTADGGPCWRLDLRPCSPAPGLPSIECYAAAEAARAPASAVYGRVARTRDRIALQYWFFYSYNFWTPAYPPTDFIWQAHEGDWEAVTVVLSRRERPLYAGVSQHCTGSRRAWAKVRRRGTHPVVYVGLGSHAGFFGPGRHRVDLRCWPQAAVFIFRAHRVTPIDVAGGGATLGPAQTRLLRVTATSPGWMRFPGFWGEREFFHAPPPIDTVMAGSGPRGPAFHELWREPIRTVLRWPER